MYLCNEGFDWVLALKKILMADQDDPGVSNRPQYRLQFWTRAWSAPCNRVLGIFSCMNPWNSLEKEQWKRPTWSCSQVHSGHCIYCCNRATWPFKKWNRKSVVETQMWVVNCSRGIPCCEIYMCALTCSSLFYCVLVLHKKKCNMLMHSWIGHSAFSIT